jgi:hypothetical protein
MPTNVQNNAGTFTRLITFTNSFAINDFGSDRAPRVISLVKDSFAPATPTTIVGGDQALLGRPMLPILTYDVTLKPNPIGGANGPIPVPRGVRLIEASTLPDLTGFNPHVTTPVTDMVYAQQQDDPAMPNLIQQTWQPAQPFSFQRTQQQISATSVVTTDKLLVDPVQFRPTGAETGLLRRFERMVFEITYVDPKRAGTATLNDDVPPVIEDIIITPIAAQSLGPAATQRLQLKVTVKDNSGPLGLRVDALYTTDGTHWKQAFFTQSGNTFTTIVQPPPLGTDVVAIFQASDRAGNVVVETRKGLLSSEFTAVFLPAIRR